MSDKVWVTTAECQSIGTSSSRLANLANSLPLNLAFLLASVLALAPALGPVPSSNENLYLLYLLKAWDPSFLARDWTFAGPFYGHWIFSYIFGSMTVFMPLETVAWIGRVLTWILLLLGLIQIGKQFRIPLSLISLAIFLWLLYQQAPVGGEWVIGTFEAKGIAYICLFFALAELMKGRDLWGACLLGLCYTFHGVVGMWALLAAGASVLFLRYPFARLLKMAAVVFVAAAPGLVVTLPVFLGDWSVSRADAEFLAAVAAPFHLDPLSFPKRDLALLAILFAFNVLTYRSSLVNNPLRLLHYFSLALGLFFLVGIMARLAGHYGFLLYYPFRLFPIFVPLLFFFSLMNVCYHRAVVGRAGVTLLSVGVLALLSLPGALGQLIQETKLHQRMWATYYDWDDLQKCFLWVEKNTPEDATIIMPPWKKESYYLTRRATIANWATPRMDRFGEWRQRIAALVGESSADDEHLGRKWADHYSDLSEPEIAALAAKYGGEYLISESQYAYPIAFASGTYKVYALPDAASKSRPRADVNPK